MIECLTVSFLILTFWVGVLKPAINTTHKELYRQEEREIYLMKLKWIRQAYPELQELTYSEISKHYSVNEAYDRISYR
jgi:hypothetical protein